MHPLMLELDDGYDDPLQDIDYLTTPILDRTARTGAFEGMPGKYQTGFGRT